ncbi:MAG TPA: lipocalin family protein [Candidatus Angelobacter sp.]
MPEPDSPFAEALAIWKERAAPLVFSRPLTSVRRLDLERFAGKWYELARYPNWFQHGCHSDVTAVYTLEGEELHMMHSWLLADGQTRILKGMARVVDPVTQAKFKVNFFKPYSGKYWVIDLGRDYEYSVIGEPERKYLWIFARQPILEQTTYVTILENIRTSGYDPAGLKVTRHSLRRAPQSVGAGHGGIRSSNLR